MSMNFGREQSLLRQRLSAVGSPAAAEELQRELGSEHDAQIVTLGAPAAEVHAAAHDLLVTYPQMGRAQMTAFVRTLWQSKIHELRAVGVQILIARAALLEPADLPFLEKLLGDESAAPLVEPLADGALGPLVVRHKKLWKDLEGFAKSNRRLLRRTAVAACRQPLLTDASLLPRFTKMTLPLLTDSDTALQQRIDKVLTAAAGGADGAADTVRSFAEEHGRKLKLPKAKPAKAKVLAAAAPAAKAKKAPVKQAAAKKAAPKKAAGKKTTRKS